MDCFFYHVRRWGSQTNQTTAENSLKHINDANPKTHAAMLTRWKTVQEPFHSGEEATSRVFSSNFGPQMKIPEGIILKILKYRSALRRGHVQTVPRGMAVPHVVTSVAIHSVISKCTTDHSRLRRPRSTRPSLTTGPLYSVHPFIPFPHHSLQHSLTYISLPLPHGLSRCADVCAHPTRRTTGVLGCATSRGRAQSRSTCLFPCLGSRIGGWRNMSISFFFCTGGSIGCVIAKAQTVMGGMIWRKCTRI